MCSVLIKFYRDKTSNVWLNNIEILEETRAGDIYITSGYLYCNENAGYNAVENITLVESFLVTVS